MLLSKRLQTYESALKGARAESLLIQENPRRNSLGSSPFQDQSRIDVSRASNEKRQTPQYIPEACAAYHDSPELGKNRHEEDRGDNYL
jgi:hypothetical protein